MINPPQMFLYLCSLSEFEQSTQRFVIMKSHMEFICLIYSGLSLNIIRSVGEERWASLTSEEVDAIVDASKNMTDWHEKLRQHASAKNEKNSTMRQQLKLFAYCAAVLQRKLYNLKALLHMESLLIFPGTKWCGKGNISSPEEELGMFRGTDKCCRQHDHAVDSIEPRSTKHGIVNPHVWPITNCDDDHNFFDCLLNDRSASRLASACVGTIYFNIIKLKCFKETYNITCADSPAALLNPRCHNFKIDTAASGWKIQPPKNFLEAYLNVN